MCLEQSAFRKFLADPDYNRYITQLFVDEAHCISAWGLTEFRHDWSRISAVRNLLRAGTPCIAQTATLEPGMLDDIHRTLGMDPEETLFINLGNDRPNITQLVVRMEKDTQFEDLCFLLNSIKADGSGNLPRSLVFFDSRDEAQKASDWLRNRLPHHASPELYDRIAYIHAGLTSEGRVETMKRFREDRISILCATECVGMGSDIADIDLVVLFKVPANLSTVLQRIGRAGRAQQPARAVFFVEPSVFEVVKPREKPPVKGKENNSAVALTSDATTYRKKVDPNVRKYVESIICRRGVLNRHFNNPPSSVLEQRDRRLCCDVCLASTLPEGQQRFEHLWSALDSIAVLSSFPPLANPTDSYCRNNLTVKLKTNTNTKPPVQTTRTDDQRKRLSARLDVWRDEIFEEHYGWASYGSGGVMSDNFRDFLAHDASITTLEQLESHPALAKCTRLLAHSNSLFSLIAAFDEAERVRIEAAHRAQEASRQTAREQRERDTRERVRLREEAKDRERARKLKERQDKAAERAYWNSYQGPCLIDPYCTEATGQHPPQLSQPLTEQFIQSGSLPHSQPPLQHQFLPSGLPIPHLPPIPASLHGLPFHLPLGHLPQHFIGLPMPDPYTFGTDHSQQSNYSSQHTESQNISQYHYNSQFNSSQHEFYTLHEPVSSGGYSQPDPEFMQGSSSGGGGWGGQRQVNYYN
jgi:superfamily II DNA helicase RecQ